MGLEIVMDIMEQARSCGLPKRDESVRRLARKSLDFCINKEYNIQNSLNWKLSCQRYLLGQNTDLYSSKVTNKLAWPRRDNGESMSTHTT